MTTEQDAQAAQALLRFAFLIIALTFSAYQTFKGYQSTIDVIPAGLLAALCAGMLGLLSLSLRSALRAGRV